MFVISGFCCHIFDTPLIIPSHMSSKNFSFLFGFLLISFIYICHDKESVFYQSSGISNRVTMDYWIFYQTPYYVLLFPTCLNFRNSYCQIRDANSLVMWEFWWLKGCFSSLVHMILFCLFKQVKHYYSFFRTGPEHFSQKCSMRFWNLEILT